MLQIRCVAVDVQKVCLPQNRPEADKVKKVLTQSDSTGSGTDMTRRHILKMTHQVAAPNRGRSLISTTALLTVSTSSRFVFRRTDKAKKGLTQSDSTRGNTDLTPQRILTVTHQAAALNRGRSLISTTALSSLPTSRRFVFRRTDR